MSTNILIWPENHMTLWSSLTKNTGELVCNLIKKSLWCVWNFNPFDVFPHLNKYKDSEYDSAKVSRIVASLRLEDIVGVWQDGIIVRWDIEGVSYKLWKTVEGDRKLEAEFVNHDLFNKGIYMWKKKWIIPDWIMIPDIHSSPEDTDWIFSMEEIQNASTLKSSELRDIYADDIWQRLINTYNSEYERSIFLDSLTDYQLEIFLIEECWVKRDHIDMLTTKWVERLKIQFPNLAEDFEKALLYLESIWLVHDDLHNSNIMVSNDGTKVYMIDFWKVKINRAIAENAFQTFY